MNKGLEALERIVDTYCIDNMDKEISIIETELILLNALRNKLNRKIETKEYKCEASNSYHIATLLTYKLKEQWNEKELSALKEFLLNLSGISKSLKALEIIKERPLVALVDYKYNYEEWLEVVGEESKDLFKSKEEYELLKEVLL